METMRQTLREEEPESYEVYEGELKRLGVQMLEKRKGKSDHLSSSYRGGRSGNWKRKHYRKIGAKKVTASEMDDLLHTASKEKYST